MNIMERKRIIDNLQITEQSHQVELNHAPYVFILHLLNFDKKLYAAFVDFTALDRELI